MAEHPRPCKDTILPFPDEVAAGEGNEKADPPFSRIRVFLLFFLLAALLYVQTLGCPFLWDEYRLILGNAQAGSFRWERLPELFCHRYFHLPGSFKDEIPVDLAYYRPVTVLFHGLSYRAFGPFFPAYHLESLFLHIGNAFLLFCLFTALLCRHSGSSKQESVALAAATLFLVHPRNVETVSIIANQTGLLCTFFSLLSVVAWVRLLRGARHPALLYCLSLVALLLGMLSKETAYGVPLVHGLVLIVHGPRNRRNLLLLCGYFLLPAIPLGVRHARLGGQSIAAALVTQLSRQGSWSGYLASVLGLLLHQLFTWLLPLDIHLFQYPFSSSGVSAKQIVLPSLAALLCAWHLRKHTSILALGFGWFLVFYLPSSNLIAIGTIPGGDMKAGAHHLYPAHAGLCLLLAAALLLSSRGATSQGLTRKAGGLRRLTLALVVVLLGSQAFLFAGFFRGADRFYQALLEKHPLYAGVWTNYGWHKLYVDKDPARAECILLDGLRALERSGSRAARMDLMNNLMVLYLENERRVEAETMLQCIIEPWTVHPEGHILLWHVIEVLQTDRRQREG